MEVIGTDARDALRARTAEDTVYGLGGNDFIFNKAAGATLIGGDGNDQYRLFRSGTIIETEDGGHDTVWAYDSVVMPDHVEDLRFKAVSDWHAIRGNDLNNKITAGEGEQAISGGRGDDTLTGGGGIDDFYVAAGDGHDVITDFTPGADVLTFWDLGITSFADFLAISADTAAGVEITLGPDQSVLLEGVALADLSEADVLLSRLPADLLDGATLTFADEFDGPQSLSSGQWNTAPSDGHPVTAAIVRGARFHTYVDEHSGRADGETYGLNPFSFDNGILSISASRTPDHLAGDITTPWVSGSLETHGLFEQTYGYFEVRAQTPEGQGFWPAFWLLSSDFSWPPELDLLEILGSQPDIYRAAIHAGLWGDKVTAADSWLVPDTSAGFHTYGMLWGPQTITFTFDGVVMFEAPTPDDMHGPMALRLNLAVGGWDGDPDDTTPDTGAFQVDYVRAYEIPGLSSQPRNTDMSTFADLEAGILNISEFGVLKLYGDEVIRTADLGVDDLVLENTSTATLVGHDAANRLTGNDEDTVFNAAGGDDSLLGLGGNDYLIGGDGNDTLEGGLGQDTLVGGAGDDTYVIRLGDGAATLAHELILEQPGQGVDTLYFADLLPSQVRSYIDWARWHIILGENESVSVKVTPGADGHDLGSYIERVVFADGTVWDLTGGLYLHADDNDNVNSGSAFDDTILGAGGNDTLVGMNGNDSLDGGNGVDALYGWKGDDVLVDSGSDGVDALYGEAGNDTLLGGAGIDTLSGGSGDDSLRASVDGDHLDGDDGNDSLYGDAGADTMNGGDGDDRLEGAGGDDMLYFSVGSDTLDGGDGVDTLVVNALSTEVTGTFTSAGVFMLGLVGGDASAIIGIESFQFFDVTYSYAQMVDLFGPLPVVDTPVEGPAFDEIILGDDMDNDLRASGGDDSVDGAGGNDTVLGLDGADSIDGGAGADVLKAGDGDDTLLGGDGNDKLLGSNGADALEGGIGRDTLSGGDGQDTLEGGEGRDVLAGGAGGDTFVFDALDRADTDVLRDFSAVQGDRILVTGVSGIADLTVDLVTVGSKVFLQAEAGGQTWRLAKVSGDGLDGLSASLMDADTLVLG